jgi:hypothetical protein
MFNQKYNENSVNINIIHIVMANNKIIISFDTESSQYISERAKTRTTIVPK